MFRKQVTVEWSKRDRYQRIVGKVYQGDVDVCLEQITAGLAWWFEKYQKEQTPEDRAAYREAEAIARAKGVGLWADAEPMPPWEFRRVKSRERN